MSKVYLIMVEISNICQLNKTNYKVCRIFILLSWNPNQIKYIRQTMVLRKLFYTILFRKLFFKIIYLTV